jgi:ArsR family transcriptional regulator, lead/cadmium/zinc/bismuth-responsive transcriptional repressor
VPCRRRGAAGRPRQVCRLLAAAVFPARRGQGRGDLAHPPTKPGPRIAARARAPAPTGPEAGTLARMSDRSDIASMDACLVRMVDRERVAAVQGSMPSAEDVEQAADVFALLGDPNRLRLLVALLAGGEMCVCDLAAAAGMSESAASHAVRWLRAHRIVSSPRRQGRMMYYRLEDAHVRMLLDLALTHTQHTQAMHPERGGA